MRNEKEKEGGERGKGNYLTSVSRLSRLFCTRRLLHTGYLLFFSSCKTSKNDSFGFSVVFFSETVQIFIYRVKYLDNGLADFNDFGLILQDF